MDLGRMPSSPRKLSDGGAELMQEETGTSQPSSSDMFHQALFVEVGVGTVALLIGYLAGYAVWEEIAFTWQAFSWGLIAALPMLALLLVTEFVPWEPFRDLDAIVQRLVGELFANCHVVHFAVLSLAAGFGEELLFRGILQTFAVWVCGSQWVGIFIAAALFGLAHPITRTYFVLATLIGAYLGWAWVLSGNLLIPIVAHAAYDFIALLWISHRIAREQIEEERP